MKNTNVTKEQAKRLLRAAVQLAKVTGQDPEKSLLVIVKSLAVNTDIRNKG